MIRLLFSGLTLVVLIFQNGIGQTSSTSESKLYSVKTFRDCPEMVIIQAGSFMMGASPIESGTNSAEGPQRIVNIRKVAVGKFNITRKEWAAFLAATNHPTSGGCSWSALTNDTSIKP